MECLPSARKDGMAATLAPAKKRPAQIAWLVGFAVASSAGMIVFSQFIGAVMVVVALCVLLWYRHMALSRFGGVTGDLAGWFLQWAELAMLAVLSIGGLS